MNKTATILVILIIVVIGIGLFMSQNTATAPAPNDTTAPNIAEDDISGMVVRYTDAGFAPAEVNIGAGTAVTFLNESSGDMWVAVDLHPTHTQYDSTSLREHCNGATSETFDQCAVGSTYTFTFDKPGTWNYHNHLRPSATGTVIVQ